MNIIELAKEANGEPARPGGVDWTWNELERFAALVEAQERHECAKIAEIAEPYKCADLIRARGTT